MGSVAFDNEKYLKTQSEHIRDRIAQFGGKLYLEFGGKLYDDHHASRVLPGFQPDSKLRMLLQLKEQVEMVIAINAGDIEKHKVRATWASPMTGMSSVLSVFSGTLGCMFPALC